MEEKENVILEQVLKIFMRYGIRSVTMDDISRELKISKKTLYKFVTDKSDLVTKTVKLDLERDEKVVNEFAEKATDALDELLMVMKYFGEKVQGIHPSIHFDLEKYYPEAWELFNSHKKTFHLECVIRNLKRGINEGLYRDNLNAEIIAIIHISRVDLFFDGEVFPPSRFNFGEVFLEMFRYHIKGISTDKGIKLFNEKLNNDKL